MEISDGIGVVLHLRPPTVDDEGSPPAVPWRRNTQRMRRINVALLLRVAGDDGGVHLIWEIASFATKICSRIREREGKRDRRGERKGDRRRYSEIGTRDRD
ncbi:hypothetical protein L484_022950 [Morus notabilis]|uniref:Uncharacterized protein n=1 Tax=Morus notabilis TaxID=981085 RepID=W9R3Z4_9ROSA|nr:hypothetical protein L484_022950 [Morus notabilis]